MSQPENTYQYQYIICRYTQDGKPDVEMNFPHFIGKPQDFRHKAVEDLISFVKDHDWLAAGLPLWYIGIRKTSPIDRREWDDIVSEVFVEWEEKTERSL